MAGATMVETMMLLNPVMARTEVTVHFVRVDQFRGLALSAGPSKVTSNLSMLVSDSCGSVVDFSTSAIKEIGGAWKGSSCSVTCPTSCCGLGPGVSKAIMGGWVVNMWVPSSLRKYCL